MICENCQKGTLITIGIEIPSFKERDEYTFYEMKCDKCGHEIWYASEGGKKG